MEQLHNGFTLELTEGAFPLSTDSIALADFVKLPARARVLDLGSGCGTLGLLLCAKDRNCQVTGLEISHADHEMALQNGMRNGIPARLNSICADASHIPQLFAPGSFDLCVSNPPYFTGGPQSKSHGAARREDMLSMDALFQGAAWALRYGGDFYLVHRPERLAELFTTGSKYGLEAKKLQLLRHRQDGPVSLVLVQCRKGGKPGLILSESFLYDRQNQPSEYYCQIYHL